MARILHSFSFSLLAEAFLADFLKRMTRNRCSMVMTELVDVFLGRERIANDERELHHFRWGLGELWMDFICLAIIVRLWTVNAHVVLPLLDLV